VDGVSEDIYLELLLFVAKLPSSKFVDIPLIKYVASDGILSFSSLRECRQQGDGAKRVVLVDSSKNCPCYWLINWNNVFACATNQFFMPESTQQAITQSPYKYNLLQWLANDVKIRTLDLYSFAYVLCSSVNNNCKLAIAYAHFLYHSLSKGYLSSQTVSALCWSMPLVDKFGRITKSRKGVLLPADVSKWADLIGSNPWRNENYVELGKAYLNDSSYAGQHTDSGKLIEFLKTYVGASDIPYISPPNAGFSAADTPLTKDNAFLLLDWIQDLKKRGVGLPERFLECIKGGRWLKVTGNGYMPPSKSFLIGSSLGNFCKVVQFLLTFPWLMRASMGIE
jgi:sacsin